MSIPSFLCVAAKNCSGGGKITANTSFWGENGGKNGSHNTETRNNREGNIIRRIMLTNVTFSTTYCVKFLRKHKYLVIRLT